MNYKYKKVDMLCDIDYVQIFFITFKSILCKYSLIFFVQKAKTINCPHLPETDSIFNIFNSLPNVFNVRSSYKILTLDRCIYSCCIIVNALFNKVYLDKEFSYIYTI